MGQKKLVEVLLAMDLNNAEAISWAALFLSVLLSLIAQGSEAFTALEVLGSVPLTLVSFLLSVESVTQLLVSSRKIC
jgi:hypothetical protein